VTTAIDSRDLCYVVRYFDAAFGRAHNLTDAPTSHKMNLSQTNVEFVSFKPNGRPTM